MEITKKYIQYYSPRALMLWESCQKTGEDIYIYDPIHNCSMEGHPHALLFKNYVNLHAFGNVLDIGCGPQPVPFYLKDYPISKIAGMDPIGYKSDHPFVFYKGLAEYLHWQNETFDTIVIGTSLDQVLLLDKVITEMHRILKPTSKLIIWTGFAKVKTNKYNPYNPTFVPFDEYHLFHFSRDWFEQVFSDKFNIINKNHLSMYESFYVLTPKSIERSQFLSLSEIEELIKIEN